MNCLPVIPWVGGKRRLAKKILPLFPPHQCYVEPFCGGAALFFMKEPSKAEILNDINGELVNLYRIIKNHPEELIRQFKWALISRQVFKWLKSTPEEILTDIQRAARFYYLQRLCFGGKISAQTFGTATTTPPKLNFMRMEEDLSMAHLRLARTYIENLGWHDCILRYDREHSLFYCDPPYWGTEGYGVDFEFEQYVKLAEVARTIKGKMIISVNDIPEMRQLFQGLPMDIVGINYTVGGNTSEKSTASRELIIRNW